MEAKQFCQSTDAWAVDEGVRETSKLVTENFHVPAWLELSDLIKLFEPSPKRVDTTTLCSEF